VRLLDRVLRRPEFASAPPVLVDVGASGAMHRDWVVLAPYAVCVAFEPDPREMGHVEKTASGFRRLVVYRAILHDRETESAEFHLTRSPYCSSVLRPRTDRLADWAFHGLFDVTETTRMPTVTLGRVLAEQKLDRVDWFKTDSQGMDLRLFRSLGEERMRRVIAAQFEPGILEAYEGEDSLADLLAFMSGSGFWMSDLALRGSQRIGDRARDELPPSLRPRVSQLLPTSPGWGEATYLNRFDGAWESRDLLLGWVIATVRRQHGFALELALKGRNLALESPGGSSDPVFEELRSGSLSALRRASLTSPVRALLRRMGSLGERLFGP
jgi:FkbM family methyltransferase